MALGYLVILMVLYFIVTLLGSIFLFLFKSSKLEKFTFYFMGLWGMYLAYQSAISLPTNYVGSQILAWGFGFLSVVGILIRLKATTKKGFFIAKLIVTVSAIFGFLSLFVL